MKILLHSYNTCFQNKAGGMQSRMQIFKEYLEQKPGIIVDYFSPSETKVEDYDLLHLFRLDIENYALVNFAKSKGIKIVISSVVPLSGGRRIDLLRFISKLPILTAYRMEKLQFDYSDLIIAETNREKRFINKHYKIGNEKIRIIPNGVPKVDAYIGKEIFDVIGAEKDYVLTVGRVDYNKNQLSLIKALKNTDIPLVIIGGPASNSIDYYETCQNEAKGASNIFMLGWLDNQSNLLKSAYANSKLFILPSFTETFGLTILEAISYGVNVAVSNTLPILEYDSMGSIETFNPYNIESIRNTIIHAFSQNMELSTRVNILHEFSWPEIVDEHIDCYNELLAMR